MDIAELLGIIGGVISLLVLLGGAWALVRGSYNKARIEALRGDNADLRGRIVDLEGKVLRHETNEQLLDEKYRGAEEKITLLTDMVTQRAEVEGVAEKLDEHHTEAMTAWSHIGNLLEQMVENGNPHE